MLVPSQPEIYVWTVFGCIIIHMLICEQAVQETEAATSRALQLSHYQATTDAEEVDLQLIERLLLFVCGEIENDRGKLESTAVQGATLVFLPGIFIFPSNGTIGSRA